IAPVLDEHKVRPYNPGEKYMSRESHLELKVGSFVLLALAGLSYFIFSVSNLSLFEKGRPLQAVFGFANGLKEAAPVRLAGVEAGLVKNMEVFTDANDDQRTKVRVTMWIKEGVEIPVDSKVTINQLGLLGEKYVEIMPGTSTEFFKAGTVVVGFDPVPMEKISERVYALTEKMERTIDNINKGQGTVGKFLTDESIYRNLDELTADLKANPWKLLYRPKNR
ncbi:MAG TPA: MlaD family protein, partial [Candidatus Omnitrophota bacterium]|nr:MlaD family protein [Candidatus Omnitrophota bacterium]